MPVFDKMSSVNTANGASVSPLSVNHTPNAIGPGMIAIIGVHGNNVTLTGATYGGVDISAKLVNSQNQGTYINYMFYYVLPDLGLKTVTVTWTGSGAVYLIVRTYAFCNTSSPIGTQVSAQSAGSTNPTVTVTSNSDELVVDEVTAAANLTACGQTQRDNSGIYVNGGASEKAGGGSTVMSWTMASSAWMSIGVPLKPIFGSGQGASLSPLYMM